MMRYRLDDLGWFHFEAMIQSLLKADLGLAVESWGGHGDLGRDAYSAATLPFPNPAAPSGGPFLFQAKFVQAANAAAAEWRNRILGAVATEIAAVKKRRLANTWQEPAHYVLLTNCPLTPAARTEIGAKLGLALPTSKVTTLGGSDICDMLDKHPELRRAFPEIMSLRDLDVLLSEVVSRPILERSRAAVEEARDLVPVFVRTRAYGKALQALKRYSFVVLDGPPEMGKTAIARTIALAQLMAGWQVVECRHPDDLFSVVTSQCQQVFVADDAFGRTEYDPVLGRMWERDLPRVFQVLDSRHRLIWTTRKHILARALREMDLTGKSSRFPDPGEVIVTAGDLSTEEKARILYRHCRAAGMTELQREIIRANAVGVVKNPHFTPERIRRFVREILPELASQSDHLPSVPEAISREIEDAIRNPTDRMRKSFRKLPESHKWVLIAFLECDRPVQSDIVRSRCLAFQPRVSEQAFQESLDDLLGTFLKVGQGRFPWEGSRIDWIHPSYRDLVIDELASNPDYQLSFLSAVSTNGVKLALSLAGGHSGEGQRSLVITADGWSLLSQRCRDLANTDDARTVTELLDVLSNALKPEDAPESTKTYVKGILEFVCDAAVLRWSERGERARSDALRSFEAACRALGTPRPFPGIEMSWKAASEEIGDEVATGEIPDRSTIDRWSTLATLIEEYYPLSSGPEEFRATQERISCALFDLAEVIAGAGVSLGNPEFNDDEGRRLRDFAEDLGVLDRDCSHEHLVDDLCSLAEEYKEHGPSEEEPDFEPERIASSPIFDVEALFEDV